MVRLFIVPLMPFGDGLGARADMKFVINASAVGVNSSEAHLKFFSYFFEKAAFGDQFQYFAFARRKRLHFMINDIIFLKRLHYLPSNMTAHGRATAINFAQGGEQFLNWRLLEQIPAG